MVCGAMSIGEYIFGSRYRWLILDTLSNAEKPLSAYRIASMNNLDAITTYRVLKEFVELGLIESVRKGRKQALYRLPDKEIGNAIKEFIKALKDQPLSLEWLMRPEVRGKMLSSYSKARFEREQRKIPLSKDEAKAILNLRAPGELEALSKLAGSSFSKYFEEGGEGEYIYRE
jgi:predicted transcriptional regulator